ncbi:MAG: Ig-like domain-containing protein [Prevotella sp.]|nr:Ig-like domain-containing protein [Prevotella sp.]
MKQNYLFKTLFLLCALLVGSVSSVWAEDVYSTCLFGPDYNSQSITSYANEWSVTNGGFKWDIVNANNNANKWEYIKFGRKNNESVGSIATADAYNVAITKVELTIDALTADKINSVKLYTSADKEEWSEAGEFAKESGVQTVSLNAPATGLYYKVEFDCASGSANGLITISKVEYYYVADPSDPSVATIVTIDDSGITNTNVFEGTAAGKLVATVSAGETVIENAVVTWASDNEEVATIAADGAVTLVAAGTAKLTATYAGVENQYKASSKTYTLTVINKDPNGPGTENNPYTVAQAIANTPASGNSDEVYIKGIVSSFYKESIVSDGSNYRYYISDDGETTTQLLVYKGAGLNKAAFAEADDLLVGDEVIICGKLTIYQNAPEVASGNYIVSLNRPDAPVDERLDVVMSFPEAAYEVTLGEDFTAPVLTITEGYDGTVAYISSDETVATVATDGAVTILAAGTTTITATAPATDNYKSATASYKLTVNAGEEPTPELSDDLFSLVTDVTVLKANDKILFVNSEASVALSTEQKSNNRGQAEVTITESNQIEGVSANVQVITLEGESGAWYFKVGDGYLYAASSKSNYLRTEAEKDDNAKATIAIDETNATITFQGENTRNVLMYNASSSLFSCYASTSTQAPVQLYVKTGTTGIQTVNHTNVADGAYFNLAGQRVAAPAKGLYIVNGKKVVLK